MDQILGKQGSKAKDVYASKISLASRVVKVERQVSHSSAQSLYQKWYVQKLRLEKSDKYTLMDPLKGNVKPKLNCKLFGV